MLIQVSPLLGCSSCDVSKRKACRLLATKAVFPPHQVKQQAQLGSQQPSTTNALFSKVDSMFVSFCSRRNAPNPVHPERALGHKGARRSRKCSISFSKSSSTQDPPQTHGFIRSLQLPKTKLINETLSMRVSFKKKSNHTDRQYLSRWVLHPLCHASRHLRCWYHRCDFLRPKTSTRSCVITCQAFTNYSLWHKYTDTPSSCASLYRCSSFFSCSSSACCWVISACWVSIA